MEDVRLGRRKYSKFTNVVTAAGVPFIIGGDENRVGITFGGNGSAGSFVMPGTVAVLNGPTPAGFPVCDPSGAVRPPLSFTVEEYGQAVTGPWILNDSVGGSAVAILETFLSDR